MKKKLRLDSLKVKSFITEENLPAVEQSKVA